MAEWLLYSSLVLVMLYAALVLAFVWRGRREDARALAGFVPDCVVLLSRLMRDPRVSRRHKWLVAALIPYLLMPIDLVPDFVPVAGQLDDAVVVALVLRRLLRADRGLVEELWPGPRSSLDVILQLAGR